MGAGRTDRLGADGGERTQVEPVSDARGELERLLGRGRQPPDPRRHQVDHVVGHFLAADGRKIEAPVPGLVVEGDEPLLMQGPEELRDEKRITGGLREDKVGQWSGLGGVGVQRVRDELAEVCSRQRTESDLVHRRPAPNLGQGEHQRMLLADFVVAVGADDQQPPELRIREQRLEQRQGSRIRPLQVVKEDHQRMRRRGKHAHELLEDQVEPVLCLGRVEGRHGRLLSDEPLERRDDIDDHLGVGAEGREERFLPGLNALLALGQQLPPQLLECLRQSAVRGVARQLIELARDEVAASASQRPVDLVNQGCFSDTGVPGHEQQLGGPLGRPFERRLERRDLAISPIQALRDREPVRHVLPPWHHMRDLPALLPLLETGGQVRLEPETALVPPLGRLGEEVHDDIRDRPGNCGNDVCRPRWHSRDVPVDDLERIRRLEGKPTGQHLVERHAEGIEVGPVVEVTVHPPRLLGRHVGDRPLEDVRVSGLLVLERQPRRDPEVDQRRSAGVDVYEDVVGIDVLMDYVALMQRRDRLGQPHAQSQEHRQLDSAGGDERLQTLAAHVLEDEHGPVALHREAVRPHHTRHVEILDQVVLSAQARAGDPGGDPVAECLEDDRDAVAIPPAAVDHPRTAAVNLLDDAETGNLHRPSTTLDVMPTHAARSHREPVEATEGWAQTALCATR